MSTKVKYTTAVRTNEVLGKGIGTGDRFVGCVVPRTRHSQVLLMMLETPRLAMRYTSETIPRPLSSAMTASEGRLECCNLETLAFPKEQSAQLGSGTPSIGYNS